MGQIAPPDAVSREQCACYPGYGGKQGGDFTDGFKVHLQINSMHTKSPDDASPSGLLWLGIVSAKGEGVFSLLYHVFVGMLLLVAVCCTLVHASCVPLCPGCYALRSTVDHFRVPCMMGYGPLLPPLHTSAHVPDTQNTCLHVACACDLPVSTLDCCKPC